MLLDIVTKGTTDYSCTIRVVDSTDGTPETGVAYNTAGVDLWYRRPGAAHTSITEVTQTEAGAHSDGGFVHISDGYCRLDLPDAAVAAGADYVDVGGTFTGMVVIGGRIRLTDVDLDDAVRGGMTALPNANAEAAGGLYTRGSGAGQINQTTNGHVDVDNHYWNGTEITTSLETSADIADAVFDEALSGHTTAGTAGERLGRIPNAAAGASGGLPTVDGSNYVAGMQGTINTLDGLDTAQDTQHAATLTRLGTPAGADISADIAAIQADLPSTPTKNVALSNFPFLMVDSTDFATPETGLTVSGTISQDGAAFGALTNSVVEISNGWYRVNLTQAEMNADVINLRFTATGAADRNITIMTKPT